MSARLIRVGDATGTQPFAAVPCVLVIGNFDGVHRGHQAVLREAAVQASASGLSACALTFDPHPGAVVGRGAPPLLTTLQRRADLMGELGIERMYVRRFDAAFASWEPDHFARQLVAETLRARVVVVGENFRFGAARAGNLDRLRKLGATLGFEVRVHAVASDARGPFSSTRAREAVLAGDLAEVQNVLGRPHALAGIVVRGDERGRTLGFPTANLDEVAELRPLSGVYAVRVDRLLDPKPERGRPGGADPQAQTMDARAGVTNIGVRPTVGGTKPSIETHLLDFSGDLYGANLRVHFVARLRDEKKFSSLDDLKAQIERDVAAAREALARV